MNRAMKAPRLLLLAAVLGTSLAAQPSYEGTWTGAVTAPQGPAEITLQFLPAADGKFDVKLHLPRMHTYGFTFPASGEVVDGEMVFAPLATRLRTYGTSLAGTFGLGQLRITLRRGGEFSPEPPAPTYPAAPAPLWTHDLGALTWASPVVADGFVYVGDRAGRFHAVRTADGSPAWTFTGPNRIDGRAVVAGDQVLFVDSRNDLVALARADGSLRWRCPLYDAAEAGGKPLAENPTFNRRVAVPLVVDDTVYCGSADGGLYALDAATGTRRWRHPAGAAIFSPIAQFDDATLAFGTMDGSVVLLDRHTQKETARLQTGGGVVTRPLLVGDRVIVGSRDYMLYGFDRATGQPAWKFSYWFSWVESTPQLHDGVIYVGASDYRRVTALDPASGRELWGTDVRGMCWGWPAVTHDTVFTGTVAQNIPGTVIRHTGGLMALDRRTGAVRWQFLSPVPPENAFGGFAGSLAVDGERVIGAGFDGKLMAFPAR